MKRPPETLPIELRQFLYDGQNLRLFLQREEDLQVFRTALAEIINEVTKEIKIMKMVKSKQTLF